MYAARSDEWELVVWKRGGRYTVELARRGCHYSVLPSRVGYVASRACGSRTETRGLSDASGLEDAAAAFTLDRHAAQRLVELVLGVWGDA